MYSCFLKAIKDNNITYISSFLKSINDENLYDSIVSIDEQGKEKYNQKMSSILIGGIEDAVLYNQDKIFEMLLKAVSNNYASYKLLNITSSLSQYGTKSNVDILSNNVKIRELGDDFWLNLMRALVKTERVELSEYIIKNNLLNDIDSSASSVMSLLYIAVFYQRLEHVKLLLQNGADKRRIDGTGISPLELSKDTDCSAIKEYIQNWDPVAYKAELAAEKVAKGMSIFNAKKNRIKSRKIKQIKGIKR